MYTPLGISYQSAPKWKCERELVPNDLLHESNDTLGLNITCMEFWGPIAPFSFQSVFDMELPSNRNFIF